MVTVLRTELYKGGHTGHRQWSRDHSLFQIRFVVIVAPFCKGRGLFMGLRGVATAVSTSMLTSIQVARNSCCEALVEWVFLSQNWAAKAAGLSSGLNAVLCVGACRPPGHPHPSLTPRARSFSHQRFQWRIRESNSTLCEFV